jgi:tetratricopeptide (TPR) repeat protein
MKKKEQSELNRAHPNDSKAISSRFPILGFPFLLVVLCFAVYANALAGDFVWDDQEQLFRNPNIRSIENIPRAFTTSVWSFMYSRDPAVDNQISDRYYRPIQTISYIIVYRLSGLSPFAFHLGSLILHSAATVLVYFLCLELGLSSVISLLAAAIFGVHPVHTEAVSWIAGVGDLLCASFYFGALLAFLRYVKNSNKNWLWPSSLCFLLALFSKEMAATFPLVALIVLVWQKEHRHTLKTAVFTIWPFVLAAGIYAAFRLTAIGINPPPDLKIDASAIDWTTFVAWIVGLYFRYSIVPYPLYIFHLAPVHLSDRVLSTFVYAAMLGGIAFTLIVWRRRLTAFCLWLTIFFVSLAPVLYFKAISGGAFFAERYLYIPSFAVIVATGFLFGRLNRTHAIFIACAVITIFSVLTIRRNWDWRNEVSLFERTVQFEPAATTVWTSLGEAYLRKGDNARGRQCFQSALKHVDDERFIHDSSYENYRIYSGLGLAAAREAKPLEAVDHLQKAVKIYPKGDAAYTTLGALFVNQGWDYSGTLRLLEKAIALNPVNDLARDYMGVALMNHGHNGEAIKYFQEALQINPDLQQARQHLDIALRATKQ